MQKQKNFILPALKSVKKLVIINNTNLNIKQHMLMEIALKLKKLRKVRIAERLDSVKCTIPFNL